MQVAILKSYSIQVGLLQVVAYFSNDSSFTVLFNGLFSKTTWLSQHKEGKNHSGF